MDHHDQDGAPTGTVDSAAAFAAALEEGTPGTYQLRLYVAGSTPQSQRAIATIKQVCESRLAGRFDLAVIDIYQQPQLTAGDQIVAAPTLLKQLPLPLRRLVGDLSNLERVLVGLDLRPTPGAGKAG
jgi:circadian clock protein KaiB